MDPDGTVQTFFDGTGDGLKDLDGVVFEKDGGILFSSFTEGKIYRLGEGKTLSTVADDLTTPADIGIDEKGRLLVPCFSAGKAEVRSP